MILHQTSTQHYNVENSMKEYFGRNQRTNVYFKIYKYKKEWYYSYIQKIKHSTMMYEIIIDSRSIIL